MVDGVNFNPFTMKAWSAEEIAELDTNGDQKISESEVKAKWSWLAGKDTEGDVAIGEGVSNLTQAAKKAGMTDTANTPEELKSNISILADEYIEQYMTEHMELSDLERSGMQSLISTSAATFAAEYIAANPQGPYDMSKVADAFTAKMEQAIADNKSATDAVNALIDGYQNNVDANYEAMLNYANTAMENKNITNSEWNQVKNKAVLYLMGMLLNGEVDKDFMQSISPNYTKSGYYKEALNAINEIKNETDPIKIQQLLTKAQNSISKFLDSLNKTNVVNGIQGYAQEKEEAVINNKINELADVWVESAITANMSDDEKAEIKAFAEACKSKFAARIAEKGGSSELTDAQLVAEFSNFMTEKYAELQRVQDGVAKSADGIDSSYNNLVKITDDAKSNGNIASKEKAAIVAAGVDLIMRQMLSDVENIGLLQGLNSDYKSTTDFKTLQTIITKIKASADPDEIAELKKQAEELLTKMLDANSGDKLVTAVNYIRPVQVTGQTRENTVNNSAIASDYQAGASRTSSYGKQNDESLAQIQTLARQDLQAIAESLKAELKAEYGDAYDEATVQKYINDAINDTISSFTNNIERTAKGRKSDYAVSTDKMSFVFLRKKGTKSGRYTYNVQALTNAFLDNFNKVSQQKHAAKLDPSKATYDFENVIADSIGNDYDKNKTVTVKGHRDDKNALSQLIEQAKAQLKKVAAAMKASLLAEGVQVSSSDIDKILEESISETIESMTAAFQYCQPSNWDWKQFGKGFAGALLCGVITGLAGSRTGHHDSNAGFYFERFNNSKQGNYGYETQKLVNTFKDIFDKKLEETKKEKEQ